MKKINRMCNFYVNDVHLAMMILPYINKKIENNENVIVLSQIDLENNIHTILNKINLNESSKNIIKQIKWDVTNIDKINSKTVHINDNDNIIVVGNEKYIDETNSIITNNIKEININIVDCYEVMNFNNNMEEILKKYKKIINTSGEKEICDIFEGYEKKEVV